MPEYICYAFLVQLFCLSASVSYRIIKQSCRQNVIWSHAKIQDLCASFMPQNHTTSVKLFKKTDIASPRVILKTVRLRIRVLNDESLWDAVMASGNDCNNCYNVIANFPAFLELSPCSYKSGNSEYFILIACYSGESYMKVN